jgi:transposase
VATKARNSWWSEPVSWETVCRRARGRSRINAWRRHLQTLRRQQVVELLIRYGWKPGVQTLIAAELRVHKSTISRDVAALFPLAATCPRCGQFRPRAWRPVEADDAG